MPALAAERGGLDLESAGTRVFELAAGVGHGGSGEATAVQLDDFSATPASAFAMTAGDFGHGHKLAAMRVEDEVVGGGVQFICVQTAVTAVLALWWLVRFEPKLVYPLP